MSKPTTLPLLIDKLQREKELLNRQIAVLQAEPSSTEMLLLIQYVTLASTKRVAEWANANGFFLQGVKGQPRKYSPKDIGNLIASPPIEVDPDLMALVMTIFNKNSKEAHHAFN